MWNLCSAAKKVSLGLEGKLTQECTSFSVIPKWALVGGFTPIDTTSFCHRFSYSQ